MNCEHRSLPRGFQRGRFLTGVVALCAALVTGCGKSPPPDFRLNLQGYDAADFVMSGGLTDDRREEIEQNIKSLGTISNALTAMFGTPDDPYVFEESGLNLKLIKMAAGPVRGDSAGNQTGLYRQHCAHCHGITGDGAGPTAIFLDPYPRDYRQGKFKFKSTQRASKPTHADLKRILTEGIAGTAMPSFMLLTETEQAALIEYVKYLSMRGECETMLQLLLISGGEELEMSHSNLVEQVLAPIAESWTTAEESRIEVVGGARPEMGSPEWEASVKKGETIFRGQKAQCTKCHGITALGDGVLDFDDWNKEKKPGELDRWLLPKRAIRPRNLRVGGYRFGRSPADMYCRIFAGITGTPMPEMGQSERNPNGLTREEIWNVIDYVRSLPYLETMPSAPAGHSVAQGP